MVNQGGHIILLNGTPYDWTINVTEKNNMTAWAFPKALPAGTEHHVYLEFDRSSRATAYGDAHVSFTDENNDYGFDVQARSATDEKRNIYYSAQVTLSNLGMQNNPIGTVVQLGQIYTPVTSQGVWVNFILAGDSGSFYGSNPPTDWMQQTLPLIGARTVREICMPHAHDSGMSKITSKTFFASESNCLTQKLSIGDQLKAGVRCFDFRPDIHGGIYATGHFSYTGFILGWQGASGQYMSDIVRELNDFTATNAELLIFEILLPLDTDEGYSGFTQEKWTIFLEYLAANVNNLFTITDAEQDLTQLPIKDFIGEGRAAVVFIVRDPIDLGDLAGAGFFGGSLSTNPYSYTGSYSDTHDPNVVQTKQLENLATMRTKPDDPVFILAWIRTLQTAWHNITESIIGNTYAVNPLLYRTLWPACTPNSYPNLLDLDNINSDAAALALAINYKFGSHVEPESWNEWVWIDPCSLHEDVTGR